MLLVAVLNLKSIYLKRLLIKVAAELMNEYLYYLYLSSVVSRRQATNIPPQNP